MDEKQNKHSKKPNYTIYYDSMAISKRKKISFSQNSSYCFPRGLLGISSTVSVFKCQPRTGVGALLTMVPFFLGFPPHPALISNHSGKSNIHPLNPQTNMIAAFCLSSLWSAPAHHTDWRLPSHEKLHKWILPCVVPFFQESNHF